MKNLTKNIIAASVALLLIGATVATTTAICHESAKNAMYETKTAMGYAIEGGIIWNYYGDRVEEGWILDNKDLCIVGHENVYIFRLEEPSPWHFEWTLVEYRAIE